MWLSIVSIGKQTAKNGMTHKPLTTTVAVATTINLHSFVSAKG